MKNPYTKLLRLRTRLSVVKKQLCEAEAAWAAFIPQQPNKLNLSHRQQEVVDLILGGFTHKDIGAKLGMQTKTVKFHCTCIYKALGLKGKKDLINKLGGSHAIKVAELLERATDAESNGSVQRLHDRPKAFEARDSLPLGKTS